MQNFSKRITQFAIFAALFGFIFANINCSGTHSADPVSSDPSSSVVQAFKRRESNLQVQGVGTVSRILADDNSGSKHQRFIVRIETGQTILIDHNIDLSPRITDLKVGDNVEFSGEYIWNEQGGLVHWTHHDPERRHAAGWLKHNGRLFQ